MQKIRSLSVNSVACSSEKPPGGGIHPPPPHVRARVTRARKLHLSSKHHVKGQVIPLIYLAQTVATDTKCFGVWTTSPQAHMQYRLQLEHRCPTLGRTWTEPGLNMDCLDGHHCCLGVKVI